MIREEAGVFTSSSLRSFYLSMADVIRRLAVVEQVSVDSPGEVGPIGATMLWVAETDPLLGPAPGFIEWNLCDGRELDRTIYSDLFLLIGEKYGPGDGSTTFNIPDARDRFIAAPGLNAGVLGSVGGDWFHQHLTPDVPEHTHSVIDSGHIHASTQVAHTHDAGTLDAGAHTHSAGTLVSADHTHGFALLQHSHDDSFGIADPGHAHTASSPTHSHASGTLTGGSHTHGFTLLQHTHSDSFSLNDPGHSHSVIDPQHDHQSGSYITANHSHGPGAMGITAVPSTTGAGAGSGAQQVPALAQFISVTGNTANAQANIQGTSGTRSTNISIGTSSTGTILAGSVGTVSGSLPTGTTGSGGDVSVTGTTGNTAVTVTVDSNTTGVSLSGSVGDVSGALPTGTTDSAGAAPITGETGTGGGGVISGDTGSAQPAITVDPAATGISINPAGAPFAETESNDEPPPFVTFNVVLRVA